MMDGCAPYKALLTHGFVVDGQAKRDRIDGRPDQLRGLRCLAVGNLRADDDLGVACYALEHHRECRRGKSEESDALLAGECVDRPAKPSRYEHGPDVAAVAAAMA